MVIRKMNEKKIDWDARAEEIVNVIEKIDREADRVAMQAKEYAHLAIDYAEDHSLGKPVFFSYGMGFHYGERIVDFGKFEVRQTLDNDDNVVGWTAYSANNTLDAMIKNTIMGEME